MGSIVATNMYKKNSSYFGRTIAFDFFLALVNDATPTVVVIMTNQKNSLVKEYFSNGIIVLKKMVQECQLKCPSQ
jgi:hypothetical protein